MVNEVVPHDPKWKEAFSAEASSIHVALEGFPIKLHHIGSTAVPGILAKPIIDLVGAVLDLNSFDAVSDKIETLGYEAMGAFGIAGRRYFRKINLEGRRTHHLHIFAEGSPHIERHLAFRDYLTRHPEKAAEYSALKAKLTNGWTPSWDAYLDGKDPFIRNTEPEAVAWYRQA